MSPARMLSRPAYHSKPDQPNRMPVHLSIVSPVYRAEDCLDELYRRLTAAAEALTGRHGRPEEIAQAIFFLLSSRASWVNGVDLKVDGGFHALRTLAGRG